MAIAETIRRKITEHSSPIFTAAGKDFMIIGGVVSNLLPTEVYLTLNPFLINTKILPWEPFSLQTKILVSQGEIITAYASNAPINILWNTADPNEWNVTDVSTWNTSQTGEVSVLLNLIVAGL